MLRALLTLILLPLPALPTEEAPMRIVLIGDSTVTDEAGWGAAFTRRFDDGVTIHNLAVGGRSAKSWYDEGRLPAALELAPDIAFVQFGHNGQPGKGPERETDPATTYRDYLRTYVNALREVGARPVLVSSVTRRTFDVEGRIRSTLTPWAQAAGAVAVEMGVPFVDLHAASVALHDSLGPERSMAFDPKPGDRTHFSEVGAQAIADLVIRAVRAQLPELAAHLRQTGE